MCQCVDDDDGFPDVNNVPAVQTPSWTYAPYQSAGPPWQRFNAAPRKPWYGPKYATDATCFIACVIKPRGTSGTCVGFLTTLTERQLADTPAGMLKRYMEANCNGGIPYFSDDGRAIVTLTNGSVAALASSSDTAKVLSPSSTLLTDTDGVVRGSVTSCVGEDITFVRIVKTKTTSDASSSSMPTSEVWKAYNQYGRNAGDDDDTRLYDLSVVNGIVYRGVITLLPPTMHAVWLSSPRKALFVTQFGRAILIGEDVLAATPPTVPLPMLFQDAFVKYVSYDVPEMTSDAEFYKPITPLPRTNKYDVVVVSGRGEAALVRIQGAFRMVTVHVNAAVSVSALRRAREEHYLPGDVLIEYRTEELFLVCTYIVGTVVVRRLHPRTGVMSAPRRLDSRMVTKGLLDGRWSLLPPAVVDVSVGDRFVWLLAGNTKYRTRTGLLHEEGHTIKPCGSFSVSHVPDRIGSDGTTSWVTMSPEGTGGLPVVLCTTSTPPSGLVSSAPGAPP